MNKGTAKKILSVTGNVLLYLFLILCVFSVIFTLLSKKDVDGTPELFGYQLRVVTSDSMAKCDATDVSKYRIKSIPIRSLLFIDLVPDDAKKAAEWYDSVKVGDVLTFRYVYTSQVTITHRVVSITEKPDGGYLIDLMGDNTGSDSYALRQTIDTSLSNSPNYIIGRVTGQSYPIGLFLSVLKTPAGIITAVILPCFVIILLEVLKIVNMVSAEKRKRRDLDAAKKDSELTELRRRLAEFESRASSDEKKMPDSETSSNEGSPSTPPDHMENTNND